MDKQTASHTIQNAGMTARDVAHSIYLATVEGKSGANQNGGYGFALSAIAELWNIKGTIGNPSAHTKITGRYKGMGVTENMIMNVVSQYPNGLSGYAPSFDDLLGLGPSGGSVSSNQGRSFHTNTDGGQNESNLGIAVAIAAFVILKFFIGWGWIISIIVAFVIAGLAETLSERR